VAGPPNSIVLRSAAGCRRARTHISATSREREPTHGTRPGSIDASRSIQVIESERRAQPYFREPTGLDRSKVQVRDRMLDMRFCVCQWEGDTGQTAKGDKNEPTDTSGFCRFHEVQLSVSSTDSIESPACRERVEDAVEMTAFTPRQAPASESGSLRSPTLTSTPRPSKGFHKGGGAEAKAYARRNRVPFTPRWPVPLAALIDWIAR
jgi:hypothetical protein